MEKKVIIYQSIIIVILTTISFFSINRCSTLRNESDLLYENIQAITDTMQTYIAKNGESVNKIKILQGDNDILKLTNKSLYDELQNMKIKNNLLASQIEGLINNPKIDTIIKLDSINSYPELKQNFDFSDQYRILSGYVHIKENDFNMSIIDDKVFFDYTLVADDKGYLYLKSNNPYVQFTNATGIIYKNPKPKHWNIGIQAGIGFNYDFLRSNFGVGPYIGLGISYGFNF